MMENLVLLLNILCFSLRLGGSSFPKPLSAAEEAYYLELCAQGDENARNILIERNLRLVAHIIKKYYSSTKDQDDLISIGTIGLIKAVSSFDNTKGARLATYAARCIENEILMYFRGIKKQAGDVYLSDPIETDSDGTPIALMDMLAKADTIFVDISRNDKTALLVRYIYSRLTKREREIIILRYGLGSQPPLTQREIAAKKGISRSYVSRIEKKALEKLEAAFSEQQ
jgi:RNA polymerase sporulation-specific sigma factor